jgi:peptide/nickel transport system substrate-binding protein
VIAGEQYSGGELEWGDMNYRLRYGLCVLILSSLPSLAPAAPTPQASKTDEDILITVGDTGRRGGRLLASLHSDPKTLNPVTAVDFPSKQVIGLLFADLIHIDAYTQRTEPALAKSWKASASGTHYTLELRHGVRFSDGHPFDADDVVFSFKVYQDEKLHSPQRDLLEVAGKPIQVRKTGSYQVDFDLPQPYAAAERLFDSVRILPRHLLERAYAEGKISQVWATTSDPSQIAGLGPFRLKQCVPGQQIVLERNPFYWKADPSGIRLPYLDEIGFLIVPTEDAEVIRFQAGDVDVISRIGADNYATLEQAQRARDYQLYDAGPGLEYNFLFFNLNDLSSKQLPDIARKQEWFRRVEFRQAVSAAIDRESIVRLVYRGRATPLWDQVTPGNKLWINAAIPQPARSLARAADLLRTAGFTRRGDGVLVDARGQPVEFSILTNPSNAQRTKIATIVQDDLAQLGMQVHIVPLEFQAVMARIFGSYDYEASVLGLVGGDADPNPEINVWTSGGATHVWALSETHPVPEWQTEIDRLMQAQTAMLDYAKRKQAYDRVQELVAQFDPVICLVSPHVLVAAKNTVGGFKPAVMGDYLLWNADQLFRTDIAARR